MRLPPRRLAATAVRPSLALRDADAGGRQPQIEIDAVEAVECNRLAVPAALAAGQQTDGGNVGRQIEPLGRKRPLQGLPAVEGQHAFAGIAVEFDIDAGKPDGPADHVGLRLECEAAKSAAGRRLLARPAQRVAQGRGVGGKRAFHLKRRPMAEIAVECEFERRAGEAHLEPGSVALQSGDEIGEADGGVDRLVMPGEAAGGGEAPRDRRPSERQFHVRERLDDLVRLVAQDDGAVLDADFGKRRRPAGAGLEVSRQRLDMARPVRAAVGVEDDGNGRAHQRDVGDLDAAGQEREKTAAARPRCSAVSAGAPVRLSPRLTSSKLTVPVGNSDTEASPRSTGSSPVTARISALTASRTASAGIRNGKITRAPIPATARARTANPRRLMPTAAVTTRLSQVFAGKAGRLYRGRSKVQTCNPDRESLQLLCDAFVAGL